jgi:hypothetical protein
MFKYILYLYVNMYLVDAANARVLKAMSIANRQNPTYMYTHVYRYMDRYLYVHIYVCIYICIYIYMHI